MNDVEQDPRNGCGNLRVQAEEESAVELYRLGKLTHFELSKRLGISRFETDAVLKRHQVYYDQTAEDVAREAEELRELRLAHDHCR